MSYRIDQLCQFSYVLITLVFAAIMALGVFFRYVLNNSLAWADEAALITFVWAIFLAVASAYRHDAHLTINAVRRVLHGAPSTGASIVNEGLTLAYLLALTVSSIEALSIVGFSHTPALAIPMTVPYLAIPVSCLVMTIHWLCRNAAVDQWNRFAAALAVAAVFFGAVYMPLGSYIAVEGPTRFWFLAAVFLVPLLAGVPVAFALGLLAFMYLALFGGGIFTTGSLQTFFGIYVIPYLAIPLLILSGGFMHASGIARDLVNLANAIVGRVKGGLGLADILASAIFADISGSAVSDTAAIGSVMIPELKRNGYQPEFAAALQGASGTLGLMFPPAITLLLYATVTNVSLSQLFAASVIPGTLVAVSFAVVVIIHAHRNHYANAPVPWRVVPYTLVKGVPGLLAGVFVVGALIKGIVTPAEAGVILLTYVGILTATLYRGAGVHGLYVAAVEAGRTSAMVLFLAATGVFLGFVLARDSVPDMLSEFVTHTTSNRYVVLIMLNVAFIALGMLLEAPAIIVAFIPAVLPVLLKFDISPIQWGVIFVINAGIGLIHPPVGLTLAVSSALAGVPYERATLAALPFIGIMLIDVAIVSAFPHVSLFLLHGVR